MSADRWCWRCAGAGEYRVARFVNGEWTSVLKPCRCLPTHVPRTP
jgi:hypothetical protein